MLAAGRPRPSPLGLFCTTAACAVSIPPSVGRVACGGSLLERRADAHGHDLVVLTILDRVQRLFGPPAPAGQAVAAREEPPPRVAERGTRVVRFQGASMRDARASVFDGVRHPLPSPRIDRCSLKLAQPAASPPPATWPLGQLTRRCDLHDGHYRGGLGGQGGNDRRSTDPTVGGSQGWR